MGRFTLPYSEYLVVVLPPLISIGETLSLSSYISSCSDKTNLTLLGASQPGLT